MDASGADAAGVAQSVHSETYPYPSCTPDPSEISTELMGYNPIENHVTTISSDVTANTDYFATENQENETPPVSEDTLQSMLDVASSNDGLFNHLTTPSASFNNSFAVSVSEHETPQSSNSFKHDSDLDHGSLTVPGMRHLLWTTPPAEPVMDTASTSMHPMKFEATEDTIQLPFNQQVANASNSTKLLQSTANGNGSNHQLQYSRNNQQQQLTYEASTADSGQAVNHQQELRSQLNKNQNLTSIQANNGNGLAPEDILHQNSEEPILGSPGVFPAAFSVCVVDANGSERRWVFSRFCRVLPYNTGNTLVTKQGKSLLFSPREKVCLTTPCTSCSGTPQMESLCDWSYPCVHCSAMGVACVPREKPVWMRGHINGDREILAHGTPQTPQAVQTPAQVGKQAPNSPVGVGVQGFQQRPQAHQQLIRPPRQFVQGFPPGSTYISPVHGLPCPMPGYVWPRTGVVNPPTRLPAPFSPWNAQHVGQGRVSNVASPTEKDDPASTATSPPKTVTRQTSASVKKEASPKTPKSANSRKILKLSHNSSIDSRLAQSENAAPQAITQASLGRQVVNWQNQLPFIGSGPHLFNAQRPINTPSLPSEAHILHEVGHNYQNFYHSTYPGLPVSGHVPNLPAGVQPTMLRRAQHNAAFRNGMPLSPPTPTTAPAQSGSLLQDANIQSELARQAQETYERLRLANTQAQGLNSVPSSPNGAQPGSDNALYSSPPSVTTRRPAPPRSRKRKAVALKKESPEPEFSAGPAYNLRRKAPANRNNSGVPTADAASRALHSGLGDGIEDIEDAFSIADDPHDDDYVQNNDEDEDEDFKPSISNGLALANRSYRTVTPPGYSMNLLDTDSPLSSAMTISPPSDYEFLGINRWHYDTASPRTAIRRRTASQLLGNGIPPEVSFGGICITAAELIAFFPSCLKRPEACNRLTNNGWGQYDIATYLNWVYDYQCDRNKQYLPNSILKCVQSVMRRILKDPTWTFKSHVQIPINDMSTLGWDDLDPESTIKIADLATGVTNWPEQRFCLDLLRVVRYAADNPEEELYFPRDYYVTLERIGGPLRNVDRSRNLDVAFQRVWKRRVDNGGRDGDLACYRPRPGS